MKEPPSPYTVLIDCLQQDGLLSEAKGLDTLLHDVALTTGSEFTGEFGLKMKGLKKACWSRMSDKTRQAFKIASDTILKVWPEIGL